MVVTVCTRSGRHSTAVSHLDRRRVAELMAALEAGSRFQAGIRAGELGLAH